jgi:hypothetical protein
MDLQRDTGLQIEKIEPFVLITNPDNDKARDAFIRIDLERI